MDTAANVFLIVNSVALVCWVVLYVFYEKRWIYKILFSVVFVALTITYAFYIFTAMGGSGEGGFDTLDNLKILFADDRAVLAGWIHYLVFDLFVGMWICTDSLKQGIGRWIILPAIILTFMLGPVGLLLYFIIRASKNKIYLQDPFSGF